MTKASFWIGLVCGLLVAVAAAFTVPFIGVFDMSATGDKHILDWWGGTNYHSIVEREAPETGIPAEAQAAQGFEHYRSTCLLCHGAPTVERRSWADNMIPKPPKLWEEAGHMSDGELFYVVEQGVRMTGMPAFAPDHSDADLWNVVALLRELDKLSPSQQQMLKKAAAAGDHHHGAQKEGGDHHGNGLQRAAAEGQSSSASGTKGDDTSAATESGHDHNDSSTGDHSH